MSANVPTVKQVAWISIVPQLIIMSLIVFVWYQFDVDNPSLNGAITYLTISFCLRTFVPKEHKLGMSYVKKEDFKSAISHFENSYTFFRRNNWLDKYRYVTLLSSSKMSYKEMALNNIAFCYGQLGDIVKAKDFYQRTLDEFPDSGLAIAGLRLLNSVNSSLS